MLSVKMRHLALVKSRVALYNPVEIKQLDNFRYVHDLLVVFGIPTEQTQIVPDCRRKKIFLLVFLYESAPVALAHFAMSICL